MDMRFESKYDNSKAQHKAQTGSCRKANYTVVADQCLAIKYCIIQKKSLSCKISKSRPDLTHYKNTNKQRRRYEGHYMSDTEAVCYDLSLFLYINTL